MTEQEAATILLGPEQPTKEALDRAVAAFQKWFAHIHSQDGNPAGLDKIFWTLQEAFIEGWFARLKSQPRTTDRSPTAQD